MTLTNCAVVLVVDGLGAGFLGPYGNTWLDTPQFNALAARSTTLENVLTCSPQLEQTYAAYWAGRHAVLSTNQALGVSVPAELSGAGLSTSLVTDETVVATHPLAASFGERIHLASETPPSCAEEIEQTQMAGVLSTAIDVLHRQQDKALVWIHARGMYGAWDAPLSFRNRLAAEDDPPPPSDVAPPALRLSPDYDPDHLLGIVHSYAGQVMLLDACLGVLRDAVQSLAQESNVLFILTSPRGYPLGEHLVVGDGEANFYGELLHVPLLMFRSDGIGAAAREPALVQPADICATLLDWFSLPARSTAPWSNSLLALTEANGASHWPRDRAISVAAGQRSIRTPAWFLRQSFSTSTAAPSPEVDNSICELFRKPDDRWESNEVASRCGDIGRQLCRVMDEFEQAAKNGDLSLSPLADELVEGVD